MLAIPPKQGSGVDKHSSRDYSPRSAILRFASSRMEDAMNDRLKSAYELAIEKLSRKDKKSPTKSTAPEKLSPRQKERIAQIRRETEAKLAEREILFRSQGREAGHDREAFEKLEEAYRRDREFALSQQEVRIKEVKRGKK